MKKIFNCITDAFKILYNEHFMIFSALLSILINAVIECLGRKSIVLGLEYVISNPFMFLYNALIVYLTLSICLIFRRRCFILLLMSFVWIFIGTVNFVILSNRTTPFSAMDIKLINSVITIIARYLTAWQLVIAVILGVIVLIMFILIWIKAPLVKGKIQYLKSISIIGTMAVSVVIINITAIADMPEKTECLSITESYKDYGFVYCFSSSIVDYGINRPIDYSEQTMNEISDMITQKHKSVSEPTVLPNIVYFQLESFFDVNRLNGMTFSENPIPVFTELKANYSNGLFKVPVIGEGTVNTEFEILTGLSLEYFGSCEYPYNTILKQTSCESLCYDLSEYGYKSHAIHNNRGNFYGRNKVFPNLGFDTFTSVEYMNDVSYNPLNWAKDDVFLNEISDTINSTEERDFVFAISVQPHGKYPDIVIENAPMDIKTTSCDFELSEPQLNMFNYYINQIHETDAVIKSITDYFQNFDEPTLVVFYGDHLPHLGLQEDMLKNGTLSSSEYVIWSNFDLPVKNKDLITYQLNAHIQGLINMDGGLINTYNSCFADDESYPSMLQYLGYDMLYGDRYLFGGDDYFFKPTETKMGIKDITIDSANITINELNSNRYDISVNGCNFTPFSAITINDKLQKTTFINSNQLIATDVRRLEEGDTVSVSQISETNAVLSKTDEVLIEIN